LDRAAAVLRGIHQLAGEAGAHRLLAAARRGLDDPAHRQGQLAARTDLDRDLIGRAADAAGLDLDRRLDVLDGLLEDLHRVVARALPDRLEGIVEDALGHRLLAVLHDHVDELRHELRVVQRIREDLALRDFSTPGHALLSASVTTSAASRRTWSDPDAGPARRRRRG